MSKLSYVHTEFNKTSPLFLIQNRPNRLVSYAHSIAYRALQIPQLFKKKKYDSTPLITDHHVSNARNPDNKGLIVFIHGLNSNDVAGNEMYKKEIIKQAGEEYEIWVPEVKKKGNCSLEEAANPILEDVRKYIETNPGKPVQLIGHSNGARIAAYIDTHLRDHDVHMRVTGIAGVFAGSDMVSLAKILGIAKFFMPEKLSKELATKSPTAKSLIESLRERVTIGSREYTFYSTVNDIAIPNYTSCFPNIQQGEECRLLSKCGHISILESVLLEETRKVVEFLKRHQLESTQEDLTKLETISA